MINIRIYYFVITYDVNINQGDNIFCTNQQMQHMYVIKVTCSNTKISPQNIIIKKFIIIANFSNRYGNQEAVFHDVDC